MDNAFLKLVRAFVFLTVFINLAALFFYQSHSSDVFESWSKAGFITLICCSVTLGTDYFLLKSRETGGSAIVRTFMLTTALKLLVYIASFITYLYLFKDSFREIAFLFLGCYLIYSVLEKILLFKMMKKTGKE